MTRMRAIFLANLMVVIAVSANSVVTLATGCSLGGNCSVQTGLTTWLLAVGPVLLLIAGTLWIGRSAGSPVSDAAAPAHTPLPMSGDVGGSVVAADPIDSVDVEDAGRNRLSRMVAFNNRVADEAASDHVWFDEHVEQGPSLTPADDGAGLADAAVFTDQAQPAEPVFDDCPAKTGPALVAAPAEAFVPHQADNIMWLIDPARPHHLAANAVTGFPWVAGVIHLFVTALASDPHFAGDADAQAEAAAWLEITATLPAVLAIEPDDGQSFVDWANGHIGDKRHLLAPLLGVAMADVRDAAGASPELAAALPAAFRHDDREGPAALALAS